MDILIAQMFGVLATIVCLILPLLKYKWQMLVCNAFSNLFSGINIYLLGQISATPVYIIAIFQVFLTLWHLKKGTQITKKENVLFLVLYVGCGMAGVSKPLDLMPPIGAVFNMLSTFQLDEQRSRKFLLINTLIFTLYYFLVGSTTIFATLIASASTIVALYKYRKRRTS